ncbi:MAG: hypothetical protein AMJ45_02455 [Syntrophobacter sp. DG_60]|nr:MAG: hypothetical protein AMJ45_02455 [Syntrophobacter sp. DG_60]
MASYLNLPNKIAPYFDKKVVLIGTVIQPPTYYPQKARLILGKLHILVNQQYIPLRGKVLMDVYQHKGASYPLGTKIKVIGRLKRIKGFLNPGRFNYALFWKAKGVWAKLSTSENRLSIMGYKDLSIWSRFLESLRGRIRIFLNKNLSSETKAVYTTLLLGEKQGLSERLRDDFSKSGVSHLLAISGLHLGMVMMLMYATIWFLFSRSECLLLKFNLKKIIVILSLIPTFIYAALTHFSPATSRAFIMLLLLWWVLFSGHGKDSWLLLAAAAWLLLIFYPPMLYNLSFQFSFLALASLIYLAPRLPGAKRIFHFSPKNWYQKIFKWLTFSLYATLAAWLGTLPLVMHYFCRLSLIAPLANIVAIPAIAFFVLPLGLLSIFTLFALPSISDVLINSGAWGLSKLLAFIHFMSNLPKAGLWVISPGWFEIALIYGVIFCVTNLRIKTFRYAFFVILPILMVETAYVPVSHMLSSKLKISFLDVGKGNAMLVQFPHGLDMVINGGSSSNFDIGKRVIAPFLFRQKITSLDYLVLTSSNYSNGLPFLVNQFRPKVFWSNGKITNRGLMDALNKRGISPKALPLYQEINGVTIESPGPQILKFTYGKFSLLLSPDIIPEIKNGFDLRSTVLLAPRFYDHSFIKSVSPKYVILSGHIRPKVLAYYRQYGHKIYSTDRQGMIKVITDGNRLWITPF